ncbi:MAG: glycosyltransferase family 10 domain-containing protein [bacterium]
MLYLKDNLFSHSYSSSGYNKPKFSWIRELNNNMGVLFLTDDDVFYVDKYRNKYNNTKIYAWLLESPAIKSTSYTFIANNYHKFEKIFTFDDELIKKCNNAELLPIGGCWIYGDDIKIHNKTKNVSMIMSKKLITSGHKLRHVIKTNVNAVDYYGREFREIKNKIEGLKDYRFSIAVENINKNYYFTEKLIDCFMTGTIPIYWGCPSIGEFFNLNGIYRFNTVSELIEIVNNINRNGEEIYESKKEYIIENFEKAKKYLIADNLIYNKLKQ